MRLINFNIVEGLLLYFVEEEWFFFQGLLMPGVSHFISDSNACFFAESKVFVLDFILDILDGGKPDLSKGDSFAL